MKYIASVTMKNEETGKKELSLIEREYDRKSDFYSDLRGNGYSVRFITTEEKFEEDCAKWHEKNEECKRIHKIQHETTKHCAEMLGMSVKEYKVWLNS